MLDRAPLCGYQGLRAGGVRPQLCETCAVQGLAVCGAFDPAALPRLEAILSRIRLAPRQTLFAEGEPAEFLFTLTRGALSFAKSLEDGRRQIVGFLGPGDFVGAAFEARYAHSAEAVTRCELCRFPRRQFEDLMARMPALEHRLLQAVSNELREAQTHLVLLGRQTARERVASFLLAMRDWPAARGRRPDVIDLPMTREDIADYLGLRLETVSRTLAALRADGLIGLPEPQRVELHRPDALARIAGGTDPLPAC
jgi:CRP/FNR family transcriptional regulator